MRAFFTANRVSLGGSLWTTYFAGMLPKDLESQLVESSKCVNKEILKLTKKKKQKKNRDNELLQCRQNLTDS